MRRVAMLAFAALVSSVAAAQAPCPSRLYVSGYFSTVHVFDACSGAFIRDLDGRAHLNGAMAVRLGPDRRIYAVSEETATILRYRNDTLAWDGAYVSLPAGSGPTGLAFDAGGIAWVGLFDVDTVRRYTPDGTLVDTPIAGGSLNGPDNGMAFAGNQLYIPGFNSNNVLRHDPATGQTSVLVPAGTPGLFRTRAVLPIADGSGLFITSEGAGRLLRHTFASGATVQLGGAFSAPTGIDYAPDGNLFVVDGDAVVRVDPATGAKLGTFVAANTAGMNAPVFLAVIPSAPIPEGSATVVEFYHQALDHYFITLAPDEIAALDSGAFSGWQRTGFTFRAWTFPAPGRTRCAASILPPATGDSHFYSADPAECDRVRAGNPTFADEGTRFHIALPDSATGACPAGTSPVYRFWNHRPGDTNHRYTTSLQVARQMLGRAYTPEGYGTGRTSDHVRGALIRRCARRP
jgi:streptogramin lyase